MKERPIPYSTPMVRARQAGTKTQTRRGVRTPALARTFRRLIGDVAQFWEGDAVSGPSAEVRCPYGQPGDRLWVREAYRTLKSFDALPPRDVPPSAPIWYEADGPAPAEFGRYRHAKFMCRWMSRGLDEVVSVRVERLQAISEADALAEGIVPGYGGYALADGSHFHAADPRQCYLSLWEAINGPGSVEANPYVWAITFRRVN